MKRILTALVALSALTGTVAFADSDRNEKRHWQRDWDDRHDRDDYRRSSDRRDYDRRDHDRWDDRRWREYRHHDRYPRIYRGHYHRPPGYVYRAWRRGDRLPVAYCAPRYIVHDYRTHRLRHPPRGYHWVRVDRDVVLAAVAGGVVAEVVTGLFH